MIPTKVALHTFKDDETAALYANMTKRMQEVLHTTRRQLLSAPEQVTAALITHEIKGIIATHIAAASAFGVTLTPDSPAFD